MRALILGRPTVCLALLTLAAACSGGGSKPGDGSAPDAAKNARVDAVADRSPDAGSSGDGAAGDAALVDGGAGPDTSPPDVGSLDVPVTDGSPIDASPDLAPTDAASDPPIVSGTCRDNWRPIYASRPNEESPGRTDFAWRSGSLYVGHSSTAYSWVFSLPDTGGAKNLLYEGHMRAFWIENERLLYAQNYDLFDMPRAGGPPTKVLHFGDGYYDVWGGTSLEEYLLDSTAIYWVHYDLTPGLMVRQHLRSGGEDTTLAAVPTTEASMRAFPPFLRQARGKLVVSLPGSNAVPAYAATVSKTGGPLTPLPAFGTSSTLLAVSNDGALLWTRHEQAFGADGGARTLYTLATASIDGAMPAVLSTPIPPDAAPLEAWSAGGNTWYISTSELDAAGSSYLSIWYVPATGMASRIACDSVVAPVSTAGVSPSSVTGGIAGEGTVFASIERPDKSWMVMRAENPAGHADTGDVGSAGGAGGGAAGAGGGACSSITGAGGAGGPGTITEFLIPGAAGAPQALTAGPDGALWLTLAGRSRLARITTAGCFSELTISVAAFDIITGPDHFLWFAQASQNLIGRVLPDGTLLRQYSLSPAGAPYELAFGGDGNVWFGSYGVVGRLTPAGTLTRFATAFSLTTPRYPVAAPDGNVWFSETNNHAVARVVPATGAITELPLPNSAAPGDMALGADGNLWVLATRPSMAPAVVRVTTAGVFTEFPLATAAGPQALCSGPDGNIWIAQDGNTSIARLVPSTGAVTEYPISVIGPSLSAITAGPDGNIWFLESSANRIGRLQL